MFALIIITNCESEIYITFAMFRGLLFPCHLSLPLSPSLSPSPGGALWARVPRRRGSTHFSLGMSGGGGAGRPAGGGGGASGGTDGETDSG